MRPSFKQFIAENFGEDHDFDSMSPHHQYHTRDGHLIKVHLMNSSNGKHAVFYNHHMGVVTKITHWAHGADAPTKQELESAGKDEELNEELQNLSADSAGKIAEHSLAKHLIDHKFKQRRGFGSPKHLAEISHHVDAINKLGSGAHQHQVDTRVEHGKAMAHAAVEAIKLKHGPSAKITDVGHTSKPGDISRFTGGKHEDGQENPSDVAVKVKGSSLAKHEDEHHYEGFSAKSSSNKSVITAKNPAIHMDGMLDHSTRKMNTEKVSRHALAAAHESMGHGGKTSAERSKLITAARESEGVKSGSSLEKKANEAAKSSKDDVAKEFHKHVTHLLSNTGDEGHHLVGKMLEHHLTADTSMPWSKVHAKGESVDKVRATVTSGSESPMRKVFKNKATKYSVSRSGPKVTIHKVEKDGSHTPVAHYTPKTKSNALKENVHGWNVMPAESH